MDSERALIVALGLLAMGLGLGVLIAMRRATNWGVALREVAGIPGAFLFSGAMLASFSLDSLLITVGLALCLLASQIAAAILWFRGGTAHDMIKKQNKEP